MTRKAAYKTRKDELSRLLKRWARSGVTASVGVQGSDAEERRDSGITMLELGLVHEYGSRDGRIPQRSFLRATYDENVDKYRRALSAGSGAALLGKKGGPVGLLRRVAEVLRTDVVRRIRRGIPPPNAERTVARKGSDTPLVDKGALLGAISVEVTGGDE